MAYEVHEVQETPMLLKDECIDYFHQHIKPRTSALVGLEYELILIDKATFLSIPFFGLRSLSSILKGLLSYGYSPVYDNGLVVGLTRGATVVSLEPGGQVEFSSSPLRLVSDLVVELDRFLHELNEVCRRLAISLLPIGYRPFCDVASVATVPRTRYLHIMPILEKVTDASIGPKMTASMQISVDYFSEQHAGKLLKLGIACQPYIVALFANSPYCSTVASRYKSHRMYAWTLFDPRRTGIPDFIFDTDFASSAFEHYVEWALDKPVLFIQREGQLIQINDLSFRDYMGRGTRSGDATLQDWLMHLGTLFPEARLKNVIEFRSADTCASPLAASLAAFWKGVAYNEDALDGALDFLGGQTLPGLNRKYAQAAEFGMRGTDSSGVSFASGIQRLVEFASQGLACQEGADLDRAFLQSLKGIISAGYSPADLMRLEGHHDGLLLPQ
jgi:glutamate--cysteine ligase